MQIRTFKVSDADGVKALISSIMGKEFVDEQKAYQYGDLDDISKAYGGLREKFLVATEEGDNIIGTAGIKEDSQPTALLRRLFVHPSHRGRGIGSMMVDTALDFCKMNNYKWVVFRATSNMTAAVKLLIEKKGFIEKEELFFDNLKIAMLYYKIH